MQQQRQQCWEQDVQTITTTLLTTTGGTLWAAAARCRDFLEASADVLRLTTPGVRVLELGAGCGTLGLTLARNLPHVGEVCLTEQAYGGALQHLRRNVAANAHLPNMGAVTCCACDWTHFMQPDVLAAAAEAAAAAATQQPCTAAGAQACEQRHPEQQEQKQQQQAQEQPQQQPQEQQEDISEPEGLPEPPSSSALSQEELLDLHKLVSTPWDIIIGSDLIYNADGAHALPRVLAQLMQPQPPAVEPAQQLTSSTHALQQRTSSQQQSSSEHCSAQHQGAHEQLPACSSEGRGPSQQGPSSSRSRMVVGRHCASPAGPVMYYAHTKHRYDNMDVTLFERLEAEGLSVEEVVEAGSELPPPSPPPFSSLFPDMRCAMFKIYWAS